MIGGGKALDDVRGKKPQLQRYYVIVLRTNSEPSGQGLQIASHPADFGLWFSHALGDESLSAPREAVAPPRANSRGGRRPDSGDVPSGEGLSGPGKGDPRTRGVPGSHRAQPGAGCAASRTQAFVRAQIRG